ncbi:hypothetical protein N806_20420 [Rhodococcus sp. P27]|nr:hypothetical protein N806_20420 [Rhodococcus sp. P27]
MWTDGMESSSEVWTSRLVQLGTGHLAPTVRRSAWRTADALWRTPGLTVGTVRPSQGARHPWRGLRTTAAVMLPPTVARLDQVTDPQIRNTAMEQS